MKRRPPFGEVAAYGYQVGAEVLSLLVQLFPDVYTEHLRHRPATPHNLAHTAQAFLTLVNERLFSCYETTLDIDRCNTLQEALTWLPQYVADNPLAALAECGSQFTRPNPELYGLPIQDAFDNGEPDMISGLTVAIWHLFAGTGFGFGVELSEFTEHLAPDAQAAIARIRPIPPWTPLGDLCATVVMRNRPWSRHVGELLAYAFNECDNPLARVSQYDMDVVYGGNHDFDWSHVTQLAEWSQEAQQIATAYTVWEAAFDLDPAGEVRALSRAVHRAARPLAEAHRPPETLAEHFTTEEEPHDDD